MRFQVLNSICAILVCGIAQGQYFELITSEPSVQRPSAGRAVSFLDVNNDGFDDLFYTNGSKSGSNNELYLNNRKGGFLSLLESDLTNDQSASVGATWADVDNDGDIDAYVVNWYGEENFYYENWGSGCATLDRTLGLSSTGHSEAASWGDFNGDGYVDLFIANAARESNMVIMSNENGGYQKISGEFSERKNDSRCGNWVDFDGDNDLDLFVGNELTYNELFRNDDGNLVRIANSITSVESNTFGSSWADVDNNGLVDLLIVNYGDANTIFLNRGNGVFEKRNLGVDGYSIGSSFGDIDNDGDLDLIVTNGFAPLNSLIKNYLYLNGGNGDFKLVSGETATDTLGSCYGAAFGDYDNDGFLDLAIATTNTTPNFLFHNRTNSNKWIKLKCVGTLSDMAAIGTKVAVKTTIDGAEKWQYREISSQTGYTGQNTLDVHFGLGQAPTIDSIVVTWLTGNRIVLTNVRTNQILEVVEPVASGSFRPNFKTGTKTFQDDFVVQVINLSAFHELDEVRYDWDTNGDGIADFTGFEPDLHFDTDGTKQVTCIMIVNGQEKRLVKQIVLDARAILGTKTEPSPIEIFPLPTSDFVTIRSPHKILRAFIYDSSGRIFWQEEVREGRLDLSNLACGVYFLNLETANGIYTERVIKR